MSVRRTLTTLCVCSVLLLNLGLSAFSEPLENLPNGDYKNVSNYTPLTPATSIDLIDRVVNNYKNRLELIDDPRAEAETPTRVAHSIQSPYSLVESWQLSNAEITEVQFSAYGLSLIIPSANAETDKQLSIWPLSGEILDGTSQAFRFSISDDRGSVEELESPIILQLPVEMLDAPLQLVHITSDLIAEPQPTTVLQDEQLLVASISRSGTYAVLRQGDELTCTSSEIGEGASTVVQAYFQDACMRSGGLDVLGDPQGDVISANRTLVQHFTNGTLVYNASVPNVFYLTSLFYNVYALNSVWLGHPITDVLNGAPGEVDWRDEHTDFNL